jgi:hypothetical protein
VLITKVVEMRIVLNGKVLKFSIKGPPRRANVIRLLSELANMPLDFAWWAKTVSSNGIRPQTCAGFKIQDFESAKRTRILKPGVHYIPKEHPITILCDHTECQIGVEYEYFFLWLVAQGTLNEASWRSIRPRPQPSDDRDMVDDGGISERRENDRMGVPNYCFQNRNRAGCPGFKLVDGPLANRLEPDEHYCEWIPRQAWHYNPVSSAPYTTWCDHEACDPFAEVKWIMIKLIVSGVLPDGISGKWL